jgi:hypothetical protein
LGTGLTGFGGIGLTGFGNRPDRFVPRVGTCSGGACICAGGARVCFGGLCSLLEHGFISDVSLLPLPKGSETCLLQVILFFAFLGFRSLVGVSFYLFLFVFLLSVYKKCVLSMHSLRGRLSTMCGSRTGGWSLPGVMSD